MSSFKDRSDYFKLIATKNKLIAHGAAIYGCDDKRKSFFRINSDAEFDAACVNWAHFPCMAQLDYTINYKEYSPYALPHKAINNTLRFLAKIDKANFPYEADAIEDAKDRAYEAMSQFMEYLREDHIANGACGNLFLFDFNNASAGEVGPFNGNLYGWQLTFLDEEKATELTYNADHWFGDE